MTHFLHDSRPTKARASSFPGIVVTRQLASAGVSPAPLAVEFAFVAAGSDSSNRAAVAFGFGVALGFSVALGFGVAVAFAFVAAGSGSSNRAAVDPAGKAL